MITDGSWVGRRFLRLIEAATAEWIASGALQDELPVDSPFTVVFEEDASGNNDALDSNTALHNLLSVKSVGDDTVQQSKDSVVLRLKPHLKLVFLDGHQDENPPDASEILALLDSTETYFRDKLQGKYGARLLRGIRMDGIKHSYQVHPHHHFELSFTAFIVLDSMAMVRGKTVGELLSDHNNLRQYIREYARFRFSNDEEDGAMIPNGLFYYTDTARARIASTGAIEGETFD